MAERLKGQECIVRFIKQGQIVQELVDVKNVEVEYMMDILEDGFVGETTDRYDDVYKGMSGSMTIQIEDATVYNFIIDIINRARRKVPMFQVDLLGVFQFSNGTTSKRLLADLRFGPFRESNGGREHFITIDMTFKCSEFQTI